MPRQYRCLVPALTFCTMLSIAGTARAATTIKTDAPPTAAEIAAVHRAQPKDFSDTERVEHHPLKFTVGHADLNGDGRADLIVQYEDRFWCSNHGCPSYALLAVPDGYSTHAIPLALFFGTMTVLDAMHHGMHDLSFGGANYVFHWNGSSYQ